MRREFGHIFRLMDDEKKEFVEVGYVRDAHGIKGEVFVRLFAGEAPWLSKLTSVRLREREGRAALNFKIQRARRHKDGIVFLFEGVVDRNFAETLKGRVFEVPEALLVSKRGEAIYLREILGFEVVDEVLGVLGPIQKFSSNGAQDLLVLEYKGREVLIPFIRPFVKKVDHEAKRVEMILPEGLLEV